MESTPSMQRSEFDSVLKYYTESFKLLVKNIKGKYNNGNWEALKANEMALDVMDLMKRGTDLCNHIDEHMRE